MIRFLTDAPRNEAFGEVLERVRDVLYANSTHAGVTADMASLAAVVYQYILIYFILFENNIVDFPVT